MENKQGLAGINRHALLMVACCAIPLALIAAVSVFRVDLGNIGYLAMLLLCPLMHLFMMRGMHGHGKNDSHAHGAGQSCHVEGQAIGQGPATQPGERVKAPATLER